MQALKEEKKQVSEKLKEALLKLQKDSIKEGMAVKLNKQRRQLAYLGEEAEKYKRNFLKLDTALKAKTQALSELSKDKSTKSFNVRYTQLTEKVAELRSDLEQSNKLQEVKEKELTDSQTELKELK